VLDTEHKRIAVTWRIKKYIREEGKIGAERVLGFVVKEIPSVEIAQERLSKFRTLPHIVVSRRKSWRKGASETLWTVFSLSGPPVVPSEIIAQSVIMPVITQTAMEEGSLSLRRPNSATKTFGVTRAGLTYIPDFVKSRARTRRLRSQLTKNRPTKTAKQHTKYHHRPHDLEYPWG